ncbi:MAG TPA: DinB family protein [Gemmatimonadales bacterium]
MLGEFLAAEVLLAHDGPAWHGAALGENLEGIDPAQAAAHPVPGAHSIWEIVLHATAWAGEVKRRLEGGAPSLPAEGDWPVVGAPTAEAWASARTRLRLAHQELAAAVRGFPESRWSAAVGEQRDAPLGTGVSFAAMVSGLLQHDGYHGGQIGLLRRALERHEPPA